MGCRKIYTFGKFRHKRNRVIVFLLCFLMIFSGGFGFFTGGPAPLTSTADSMGITTYVLSWARAGEDYSQSISVTGGTPPYTFFLAPESRELPAGLSLSEDGVISGNPSESGSFFNIVIAVRDSEGMSAKQKYRLNIRALIVNFDISENVHYYDGTPKSVKAIPIGNPELVQDVDYTVLYSGMEKAIDARRYGIRIIFNNPKYDCGSISNRLFEILPSPDCNIELADKTVEHTGAPQTLVPNITPSGLAYSIYYAGKDGTVYSKSETPPSDPGRYLVTAKLNDKNYEAKEASATLKIKGIPVSFTAENNQVEYIRGTEQKANVIPSVNSLAEGMDYSVSYDNIATDEVETLNAVENVGTYKINIEMKNKSYDIESAALPNMVVYPKKVNFTVSAASAYYDAAHPGTEYSANPVPSDNELTEDKYSGGVHDASGDYYIVYKTGGDPAVMREGSVTLPGVYSITVVFNSPNYTSGMLDHDTFVLAERQKISFAISDNIYEYSAGVQRRATVAPLAPHEDFTDYTVTYDDTSTGDIETDESVEKAGRYVIRIALGAESINKGYAVKNPTPGFLDISRNRVDFNADKVNFVFDPVNPSGVYQPKLTLQRPEAYSLAEGSDYEVYYSDTSTGEKFDNITKPGKYNVQVRFLGEKAQNYIMGDVRPQAWFEVKLKGWIEMIPGNSAAGLIMSETSWDEQKKQDAMEALGNSANDGIYSFGADYVPAGGDVGHGFNAKAWADCADGVNFDLEAATAFIGSLDELKYFTAGGKYGCKALNGDKTPVDSSAISVKIKSLRTVAKPDSTFSASLANALKWTSPKIISRKLNTGEHGDKLIQRDYIIDSEIDELISSGVSPIVGVYDIEYSFVDKDGNAVKAVRKVAYLGRASDVNMDGNVNDADAYRLRLWKHAEGDGAPSGVAALHYFRGCDVNRDGKIIADPSQSPYSADDDASRIIHRFTKP